MVLDDAIQLAAGVLRGGGDARQDPVDGVFQFGVEHGSLERARSIPICYHHSRLSHPVWTDGGWTRYLFTPAEVRGVIGYTEKNPDEIGWPHQQWAFVKPYDGWPLHPGHNPNSPWAKGLRGAGR